MKKVYTFSAALHTYGTVSVFAESAEEAVTLIKKLEASDEAVMNVEIGNTTLDIDVTSTNEPDVNADDGTHYYTYPRLNAEDNAEVLELINEE